MDSTYWIKRVLAVGLFSIPLAWGSDYQSPRTAGLGGAGHAGPSVNDAIYLNPSYASLFQSSTFSINYLSFNGGGTLPDGNPEYSGHHLNLSTQDGRSELFEAGVGFTQRGDANILTMGASKNATKNLGFGVGGKFFFPSDSRDVIHDMTVSMSVIPNEWLQVVAVVDNLVQSDQALAHNLVREYILGTKVNVMQILLLYFDPHYTPSLPTTYGHELGIEFALGSDIFLRMGQFANSSISYENGARGRGYGFGLGWITPRMVLDYGMSRALDPIPEVAHTIGTTLYFF